MQVKVKGLPFFLEYEEKTCNARLVDKRSSGFIKISLESAVQFELLAKQDDILESLRLIERHITGNQRT